jgi:AcrR family transcriptional regulator
VADLTPPPTATRRRLTATQRRDQVLAAAFIEFAARGYHATGTADIAQHAHISQPYIYALFADKKALFLACHERAMQRLRAVLFEAAVETEASGAAFARIERAFGRLYASDPTQLMFQLQSHAAASDPEIRGVVRQRFMDMVDDGVRATGASRPEVIEQLARGMFMTVAIVLELPGEYRLAEASSG